jgi:hypothetical protein
MEKTTDFFVWFLSGLNGLGGWFLFLLLALAAVIFMLYDISHRRLVATGWKMGVILLALLLVPIIIYRFSGTDTQLSLNPFKEAIFYLGMLGGVLPPVLAVGYYVTFRGIATCDHGHQYDIALGGCPECRRVEQINRPIVNYPPQPVVNYQPQPPVTVIPSQRDFSSTRPGKKYAPAWLVGNGHNYQLYKGETTIGRGSSNDIQITEDETLSRSHAKIVESNDHFRLYDLGSPNGTFVNGRRMREPQIIEHGDEIRFGAQITLRFTASRQ